MTKLEIVNLTEKMENLVLTSSEDELLGRIVRLGTALNTATDANAPKLGLELALLVAFIEEKENNDTVCKIGRLAGDDIEIELSKPDVVEPTYYYKYEKLDAGKICTLRHVSDYVASKELRYTEDRK